MALTESEVHCVAHIVHQDGHVGRAVLVFHPGHHTVTSVGRVINDSLRPHASKPAGEAAIHARTGDANQLPTKIQRGGSTQSDFA